MCEKLRFNLDWFWHLAFLTTVFSSLYSLNIDDPIAHKISSERTSEYDNFSSEVEKLYLKLDLSEKISPDIFKLSVVGYFNLRQKQIINNNTLLTIIDYTLPSTQKRLVTVDLDTKELLFYSLVAHGKNTGENYARHFSNKAGTLKSSIGFYKTGDTYFGVNGFSLKLKGLDRFFNDNAEQRAIVLHGAWYVSEDFAKKYRRLGRSWGCPAVSKAVAKEIINTIKDGSCLFIYYDDEEFLEKSEPLNIDSAVSHFFKEMQAVD
jgi:hypothetical protein